MCADIVVVGLGYVGLPLAAAACDAGLSTIGYDISPTVADGLCAGRSHVSDITDSEVAGMVSAGFTATTDPVVISQADAVVLCVPTGLSPGGTPDLCAVRAATHVVASQLRPRTLVVLESTSFPGTTDEVVRPILEEVSGLRAGEDFALAYSPERIDPGNRRFRIGNTPKIVSGFTPLCAKHAAALYGRFVDSLVVCRGTREAELAKLLENTYRYVNIALVNEVALYCEHAGIDVWDVLRGAATKPFGFAAFQPGPGVGGHCIPIDPMYLSGKADAEGFSFRLLSAAKQINSQMPEHVVQRTLDSLSEHRIAAGAGILLLGVSYKPDVADVRESPAIPIARGLLAAGATVTYHDPYVPDFSVDGVPIGREEDLTPALDRADVSVLLQDHVCYDPAMLARRSRLLLDTRGKATGDRVRSLWSA
jgi:nucleotide sugar dehydrogenase